jgi:hypothetical protein
MAEVIIHETLQPTDEVLARHRRVFEESGTRVLGEPQVELVPNPHAKGSHEPSEFYRITFQVEAPEEVPGVEALSDDELTALVRLVQALVDYDEAVLREAGAFDHGDPYEFTRRWRLWDARRSGHAARRTDNVGDGRFSTRKQPPCVDRVRHVHRAGRPVGPNLGCRLGCGGGRCPADEVWQPAREVVRLSRRVTPVTIPEHTWRSAARQPELALFLGRC